jgi:mRNA interferase RelE/StbE
VEKYRLLIKPSAPKKIERISQKKDRQRVVERIGGSPDDPRPPGCQKLSGRDRYRVRQGAYRIIYAIEDERLVVYVVRVGHRREVYRQSD